MNDYVLVSLCQTNSISEQKFPGDLVTLLLRLEEAFPDHYVLFGKWPWEVLQTTLSLNVLLINWQSDPIYIIHLYYSPLYWRFLYAILCGRGHL